MATVESPFAPTLGEHGEPCAGCGSPLASDQRYCLNCGRRRAEARLPFDEVLAYAADGTAGGHAPGGGGAGGSAAAATAPVPPPPERGLTPLAVVLALSAVVVALGLGVVLGRGGSSGSSNAKPQVITVGGAAATAAPANGDANAAFTSDWPDGQEGYTVQLQVLPKDGTQPSAVATAKSDAQGKGATAVGALDSDAFASLPTGNYVVYSGVFKGKAAAAKALKKLEASFPDAKVVRVSATPGGSATGAADPNALNGKKKEATVGRDQLKQLQGLSPDEYQKKSQKLPDTTAIQGAPPPKDNKAPGGGSGGATVIG